MDWVFQNLWQGLQRYPLWLRLAVTDIQQTYRRSLFGVAWVAFSFALFIVAKIIIFGSISTIDTRFFALWLTIGFWIWTLISALVIDGCNSFIAARTWILGTNLPLSIYVFQTTTRCLIRFSFAFPVIILLLIYDQWAPHISWLWSLLGFLVIIANGLWVQIFFGSVCIKYRDVTHLMTALMQVLFFLTPILYVPEQLGSAARWLEYNPFTHYLAVMRDPILSNTVPVRSWAVVGVLTTIGWIFAITAFKRMGRDVPFRV